MITAVDTSVVLDVFASDPRWGIRSADLLSRCLAEGTVIACEVVWAECAVKFERDDDFIVAMSALGVAFSPIEPQAASRSAQAWRSYLRRGGKRQRVMADFLVGGHAIVQADRLLTRDRGFYRDYFKGLRLLDPSRQ